MQYQKKQSKNNPRESVHTQEEKNDLITQFYNPNPDSMYDNVNLENVGQNHNENYKFERNKQTAKYSPKTGMIFGTHAGVGSHFN